MLTDDREVEPNVPRARTTATIIKSCRMGACAAFATLLGILLSGPLAVVFLTKTHQEPRWQSAELYARNFHISQVFPYFAGFFLVGGYAVLMASLHTIAGDEHKPRTTAALLFTSAFVSLVFLNYIVQTTFVPGLARRYAPDNDAIIAAFSMANPASLAWAIEMWAWGFLGVATWLVAPVFTDGRLERLTASTFVANGVVSVLSAVYTAARPAWVMTTAGLIGFSLWNVLVFAMSALALVVLRRRIFASTQGARAPSTLIAS